MVDVIISLAVSETFKEINRNIKCILIISRYPLYDYADVDLHDYFEDVYILPYCDYEKNLIEGYMKCNRHYKKLDEIKIGKDPVFFFYDDSELPCFNIYKFINAFNTGNRAKLVHLTYQYDPIRYKMTSGTNVAYSRTLLLCLYSLILFRKKIICRYLPGDIKKYGRSFKSDFNCEVFLNRKSPKEFESEFEDFPVNFDKIKLASTNTTNFKPNSILFLGHNLKSYIPDRKEFAESMNPLLNKFRGQFRNYNLYLKLHPHDCLKEYAGVSLDGFEIIDKNESLEKVIVFNRANIKAVYSVCSSGNFCSAMLGIPSYLLYPIFGFGNQIEIYFEKLFFGEEDVSCLRKTGSLDDISEDNMKLASNTVEEKININKWVSLYNYLKA